MQLNELRRLHAEGKMAVHRTIISETELLVWNSRLGWKHQSSHVAPRAGALHTQLKSLLIDR